LKSRETTAHVIPAADPRAGYLSHKAEIDLAIGRVLESGWYILGAEVRAFEQELATFCDTAASVGVASGTDALALALRASGVGRGDTVATVSHTAVATVAAIESIGAVPLLVDVDLATFTMDPNHLEDALRWYAQSHRGRVRAVVPVHLYGQPCDMAALAHLAEHHALKVIEDSAQSLGARLDGRATGTWGDAAALSFYPTKNLGAFGDGGAVLTRHVGAAERVRSLREYGWRERFISHDSGTNSRLDEIQAAALRVKLRHLDSENRRRGTIAARYTEVLDGSGVIPPAVRPRSTHVFHQYVARCERRDALQRHLRDNMIATAIHYPVPVHLQPSYEGRLEAGPGGLPRTELLCGQILSLPVHPQLSDEQVSTVAGALASWVKQAG